MNEIPDALTLDNCLHLESIIKECVKKIKTHIISSIKSANASSKCSCNINVTSFVPGPDQLGDDYKAVLMQICENVTVMLEEKHYTLVTNITSNGNCIITVSWKKKQFDGKCPTFSRYMQTDQ